MSPDQNVTVFKKILVKFDKNINLLLFLAQHGELKQYKN